MVGNAHFARGDEGIEAMRTGQEVQKTMNGSVPEFFIHRVAREDNTIQEQECVRIMSPGDLKSESIRKVTAVEKQMFPDAYEAFKNGVEATVGGTALELFLGKDDPRIRELHYHKLHTVEQVAQISDTTIQALGMGYRELRDQCAQFIERQTGGDAMAKQNEMLMEQMAKMQEQLDKLAPKLVEGEPGLPTEAETVLDSDTPEETDHPGLRGGMADALEGTPEYTLKPGFQGAMQVLNSDNIVVHDEVGAGSKQRCEDWIEANKGQTCG